ncbi:MAG TPA: PLD nuclease N-terminal domain-containing protein [Anaerolineaceae bacterium]|nr:PLD nuclease N-terminal domain-containing protein [Anaerolineaceae bacterium]
MKVKICPKCGGHNLDTALFCANPACSEALSVSNTIELDERSVHFISSTSEEEKLRLSQTPAPSVANSNSSMGENKANDTPPSQNNSRSCSEIVSGCIGVIVVIAIVFALIVGISSLSQGSSIGEGLNNLIATFVATLGGGLGTLLILGCGLSPLIFTIWTMVDCIKNEPNSGNDKIIWVLIILFLNFIGSFLYILIRRPERKRQYGY